MICTTYFLTFFSELIPPTGIAIIIYMISTTHSVSTTDFNEKNAPTM